MNVYDTLKKLGIILPEPPPASGLYLPVNEFGGSFLYTSGVGPVKDGKPAYTGKAGDVSLEYAQAAARQCILNILSIVDKKTGDLNVIKRVVKMLGFVASTNGFTKQPLVMNAASELLGEVFGENGRHARSAIGVNVLPEDFTVEIELIFELK
jgi:enamine deaminase RidA (YjgF/YER057c/UK114 family)